MQCVGGAKPRAIIGYLEQVPERGTDTQFCLKFTANSALPQ